MSDRFDFEQRFLESWVITQDLKLLAEACEDIEDPKVADNIMNLANGLIAVYDAKFQKTWEIFEELVHNQEI